MSDYFRMSTKARILSVVIVGAGAFATVVACSGPNEEASATLDQSVERTLGDASGGTRTDSGIVVKQDASTLDVVTGPCQWSTSDGSPVDVACCAGESAAADAGGGQVCVIGTHGNVGVIQCMPPPGIYTDSGATQLLCSVCYAGQTQPDGGPSVAQCIALDQGADCHDVIACTGSVEPRGPDGTCGAVMICHGSWVDGCDPPNAITPSSPGICYRTAARGDDAGPTR